MKSKGPTFSGILFVSLSPYEFFPYGENTCITPTYLKNEGNFENPFGFENIFKTKAS